MLGLIKYMITLRIGTTTVERCVEVLSEAVTWSVAPRDAYTVQRSVSRESS